MLPFRLPSTIVTLAEQSESAYLLELILSESVLSKYEKYATRMWLFPEVLFPLSEALLLEMPLTLADCVDTVFCDVVSEPAVLPQAVRHNIVPAVMTYADNFLNVFENLNIFIPPMCNDFIFTIYVIAFGVDYRSRVLFSLVKLFFYAY